MDDEYYKDEDFSKEDNFEDRVIQSGDQEIASEKNLKEDLRNEFLLIESTILTIGLRFYLPKYKELCERLSDVSSKLDLTYLITDDFEHLIDILIEGAYVPGEHHSANLDALYSLCEYQAPDIGQYLVAQGLLNLADKLLDENDMPESSVATIIRIFASLAHMNNKICNDVQKKFTVFYCHDIFTQNGSEEILTSCALFFSSVSRFPLNDKEITSILDAFTFAISNEMEFAFSPLSYAVSNVCGRKGQTYKLINQFDTINQLIYIKDFNDDTKLNMINAITLSSRDPNIIYSFEINIILDELESENFDIAAAAANCISMLVQNRPIFLNDFNVLDLTSQLLTLYSEKSTFKARRYVAEAICSLAMLLPQSDLFTLMPNHFIECISFLMKRCLEEKNQLIQ